MQHELDLHKSTLILSPSHIEKVLISFEQNAIKYIEALANRLGRVFFYAISFLTLFYFYYRNEINSNFFQSQFFPELHYYTVINILPRALILVVLLPFIRWARFHTYTRLQLNIFLALIFLFWLEYQIPWRSLSFIAFYFLVLAPLIFFKSSTRLKKRFFYAATLIFATLSAWLSQTLSMFGPLAILTADPSMNFIRSVSLRLQEADLPQRPLTMQSKDLVDYFTSPITYMFFLPVKSSEWKLSNSLNRIQIQGLLDVFVGLFAFILCRWLYLTWPPTNTPFNFSHWLEIWFAGWRLSLGYTLGSLGWFRFANGAGRLLGYEFRDGCNFSILATNPIDSWRRWSTYLYEWMLIVVFFPVQMRWRNQLLSFLVCFFVLFILHVPRLIFHLPFGSSSAQKYLAMANLIYFSLHGIALFITVKTKKLWPSNYTMAGWFGIFVTQITLGAIHIALL